MSGGELDLDAIERRVTLILAEENREHDFQLMPHPGGQRCIACGLPHAQWDGDGCPGTDPEPLPDVSLGLETTLALVAEVRRLRALVNGLVNNPRGRNSAGPRKRGPNTAGPP